MKDKGCKQWGGCPRCLAPKLQTFGNRCQCGGQIDEGGHCSRCGRDHNPKK